MGATDMMHTEMAKRTRSLSLFVRHCSRRLGASFNDDDVCVLPPNALPIVFCCYLFAVLQSEFYDLKCQFLVHPTSSIYH
mmetsp:Transcript_4751/g.8072  ORF Transcript_4751/g.8072 Transcript_4751/m.8072 type:complete len:80 (+) Transcript_4751:580-819(+)